jgi:hypothetical protein
MKLFSRSKTKHGPMGSSLQALPANTPEPSGTDPLTPLRYQEDNRNEMRPTQHTASCSVGFWVSLAADLRLAAPQPAEDSLARPVLVSPAPASREWVDGLSVPCDVDAGALQADKLPHIHKSEMSGFIQAQLDSKS